LWIYPLGGNEPTKVLTGQIMAASWAPDGTKLVFALRPPYFELWTVDLDPGVSTVQALGPGRTLADHWQDMLRLYARRIETDPQDAYAYAERARCYGHLHERTKAEADMQRWSAVVNGGSPSDSWFDTLHANFTFGTPVNIQSTFPSLDPTPDEFIACFSADGLEVYCESAHKGGQGGLDLWVYKRASVEDDWGSPENLGPMVNSASTDWGASITSDGLELYFSSNRPGGCGATDIYVTRRATRTSPWGPPANPGSQVNGSLRDQWPSVSSDGRELYVSSNRPGGLGESDLYVSKRATIQDPWGDPVNLGPAVNSPFPEIISRLSPDGLLLFFHSPRPGRFGKHGDGYAARRASCSAPWQPAVNLGPLVNATPFNWPVGCPDGWALYIVGDPKDDGGNWIYQVPILPIVDFNADGKVDAKDLDMLRADWGKSNSVCDIGPYAWGDDKVDLEDQKVFMTYYERENPSAQP
jgi:Tol biopolymer transport system component